MKYALEIVQEIEEESNVVAVDAEGEYSDGCLVLSYAFDGARYTLVICEDKMVQERKGEISMKTVFAAGKTTVCEIVDGDKKGAFEVRTEELSVSFDGADCNAICQFTDPSGAETTRLAVTARVLQ